MATSPITQHEELDAEGRDARLDALVHDFDAAYPMMAPSAAVRVDDESDAYDAEILAGLVCN